MEWIKYSLVYTADSIRKFDSKIRFEIESDGRFDSRFDSNAKKRFAGLLNMLHLCTVYGNEFVVWCNYPKDKIKYLGVSISASRTLDADVSYAA